MNFLPILLSAVLAIGVAAPSAAADKAGPDAFDSLSLMHAVGTLVTEPDGSVSAVQIDTRLEEPLRSALQRTLAGFRFKQVLVAGVPQRTRTAFDVSLAARRSAAGKDYDVTIDGVDFKAVKGATLVHPDDEDAFDVVADGPMKPPVYPRDAEFAGAMGRVLLAVHFTADGRADKAAVVASMLYDTRVPQAIARRSLAQFERAALDISRQWRAKVVAGKATPDPDGFTAMAPVVFTLSSINLDADGQWLPVKRLPTRPIPWKDGHAAEVNDSGRAVGFVALGGSGIELERSARGTPVL